MKRISFSVLIAFSCILYAQGAQDILKNAWELWTAGDCSAAMDRLAEVRTRIDDFPVQLKPQIEATYIGWMDTIAAQEERYFEILSSAPALRDEQNTPLPIDEIQSARLLINELLTSAENIACRDIKVRLLQKLFARQDSATMMLDKYIDAIIGENVRLSTSLDSLRGLARRYHHLLPLLDSLRSIVAQNADKIEILQAQMDSMVTMASQAVSVAKYSPEELPVEIVSPTQVVSNALLEMIESRLVFIGENKIRARKFAKAQKDSIMKELYEIAVWLDTSMVAKTSPQKSTSLKQLAYSYMDLLTMRPKPQPAIWIVGIVLLLIVLIAVAQAFRRKR